MAAACVFGAARLRGERIGQTEIAGAAGALLYFTPEEGDLSKRKISFRITPVRAEVDPKRVLRPLMQVKMIVSYLRDSGGVL